MSMVKMMKMNLWRLSINQCNSGHFPYLDRLGDWKSFRADILSYPLDEKEKEVWGNYIPSAGNVSLTFHFSVGIYMPKSRMLVPSKTDSWIHCWMTSPHLDKFQCFNGSILAEGSMLDLDLPNVLLPGLTDRCLPRHLVVVIPSLDLGSSHWKAVMNSFFNYHL